MRERKTMLNSISIVGRLTNVPETRKTANANDITIAQFDLANNGLKDKEGNEDTLFIRVQCFGTTADACAKYLDKGALVSVQGRLHAFSYINKKTNAEVKGIEIIANSVDFIDTRKKAAEEVAKAEESK